MNLKTPLAAISGIGPSYIYRLSTLNLHTVEDLLFHFPFRYDDFSNVSNVMDAKEGEKVTLVGELWSIKTIYTRSRKVLTQGIFNDGTGPINLTWFNQPWLSKSLQTGDQIQISGKLSKYKNKLSIMAPVWEKVSNIKTPTSNVHTGRLVPVYPETSNITSKWIRTKISQLLPQLKSQIEDPLPENIREEMLDLVTAIDKIHFPASLEDVEKAQERLGFDELFLMQLATQKVRSEWRKKPIIKPLKLSKRKLESFIKSLPFELTKAQAKVANEILDDLQKTYPMNRLVQGEVGSGKTVVSAIIAYIVHTNKLKTLFMAPTEILAFQHFETFRRLLEPLGLKIGIYTGSKKKAEDCDIIIGTHALLSEKLVTEDVGLVVIDEQQRFGVEQRAFLRGRAKLPHFLTMTATPIPRTIALTMYGDLDISVIDELPKNRQKIKTYVVPAKKRTDAYGFISKKVREGDQVYIITPLIEESETIQSAKAATVEFEKLRTKVFPDLKLGLLHGRLKPKEKDEAMQKFNNGEIQILVSTSVVEVGVDVSNATIMVIESAERFGLSQLHQLRGRVGRGVKQSFCLLFPGVGEPQAVSRLKNLEKIDDGLKLAELDLKIRGSGQIFGTAQSGRVEFKIADFSNVKLIERARNSALKVLLSDPTLDQYPNLKEKLGNLNVAPD